MDSEKDVVDAFFKIQGWGGGKRVMDEWVDERTDGWMDNFSC